MPEAIAGHRLVGMDGPEPRRGCGQQNGGALHITTGAELVPARRHGVSSCGCGQRPVGENSLPRVHLPFCVLYGHFQAVQQISMSSDFNIDILLPFLYLTSLSKPQTSIFFGCISKQVISCLYFILILFLFTFSFFKFLKNKSKTYSFLQVK